jgi:hypothetical protein
MSIIIYVCVCAYIYIYFNVYVIYEDHMILRHLRHGQFKW